jgi:pimeloyl-ACP methyl ester carboxylesterase
MKRTAILLLLAALAFGPAGTPLSAAAPASELRSGFVNMPDGAKLHYLEGGPQAAQGPAILFIPGWTMPGDIWEPQLRHFVKTHRVVALDPRSQGLSSKTGDGSYPTARAQDLAAVIDGLKLSPAVLVCWSMGVTECLSYVGQSGTKAVAGLVLVDGLPGAAGSPPERIAGMVKFASGFQRDRRKATADFVRSMYRTPQTEEYLQKITEASLRTPTDTALALFLGSLNEDSSAGIAKVDKPTLVIGTQSPFLKSYEEMQKKIPGARLEVFEGAGHALFVDQADKFNQKLEEFLKALPKQAAP